MGITSLTVAAKGDLGLISGASPKPISSPVSIWGGQGGPRDALETDSGTNQCRLTLWWNYEVCQFYKTTEHIDITEDSRG